MDIIEYSSRLWSSTPHYQEHYRQTPSCLTKPINRWLISRISLATAGLFENRLLTDNFSRTLSAWSPSMIANQRQRTAVKTTKDDNGLPVTAFRPTATPECESSDCWQLNWHPPQYRHHMDMDIWIILFCTFSLPHLTPASEVSCHQRNIQTELSLFLFMNEDFDPVIPRIIYSISNGNWPNVSPQWKTEGKGLFIYYS